MSESVEGVGREEIKVEGRGEYISTHKAEEGKKRVRRDRTRGDGPNARAYRESP